MTNKDAAEIILNYNTYGCGYCHEGGDEVPKAFDMAAKALLKEQEPVQPKEVNMYPLGQYACGACGHISIGSKKYHAKFCPECGRMVKWDD